MIESSHRLLNPQARTICAVLAAAGAAVLLLGLALSPARTWHNLLLNNFYALSLSIMGTVFIAIQYLTKAAWSVPFRRVPEAMTAYVPLGSLLMLALYFGMRHLYPWTDPAYVSSDPALEEKAVYLNVSSFYLRMFIVLGVWWAFSCCITRNSRQQDDLGKLNWRERNLVLSGIFAVVFPYTYSVGAFDWLMSLDPHWYSTLFAWYVMSSAFVGALAVMTVFTIVLRRAGHLPKVNVHHIHDLGKLVFAFSVFWAYLWFSQYMLIWYTNIPEENGYYMVRGSDWFGLFSLNPLFNLGIAFLILPAAWKKNERYLMTVCLLVAGGHWLDFYLMVMPHFVPDGPHFGFIEIGTALGTAALLLLVCNRALSRHAIRPENDPFYLEGLYHHG